MTKGRRKKEVHQGILLLKIRKEGMTNCYLILNASIAIRQTIMLVTIPRGEKDRVTTQEAATITKEENTIK